MGTYLNPGNSGFSEIIESDYVDKTELISLVNHTIGTKKKLTCISRPRRFGKSYAAQMLCAYYDHSCDSHDLFDGYAIAKDPDYDKYLNHFHVISIDVTGFISNVKAKKKQMGDIPARIESAILAETQKMYPDLAGIKELNECLLELVRKTGMKIVFVIDEWDSMIREAKSDEEAQERYLNLLRGWFKNNNFTPEAVAVAYMTGILPIKKDGSQSAISDFQEYSVLRPGKYAGCIGFNSDEVEKLCKAFGKSFDKMKMWYDGYTIGTEKSIYNPYSVMQALETGAFSSYWRKTSAAEALMTYIDLNQNGLQEDIVRLIAGEKIEVDTDSFQNDMETFTCKDDVLTLLIHLGYLTYEEVSDSYDDDQNSLGLAGIPNEEVRTEFKKILSKANHKELVALIRKSDQLLTDTLEGNVDAVAEAISDIHDSEFAPTFYNNEQSLRYVVKMAYISCVDQYAKIEELPSGHGIADVVFLPKRSSALPAMIVELKWNEKAEGALRQIKEKNYPKVLGKYGGEIVLVGVSYDEKTKAHSCKIEKMGMK